MWEPAKRTRDSFSGFFILHIQALFFYFYEMKTKLGLLTLLFCMISFAGISATSADPAQNSTIQASYDDVSAEEAACTVSIDIPSFETPYHIAAILNPETEPIRAFYFPEYCRIGFLEQRLASYSPDIFRPRNWRQSTT